MIVEYATVIRKDSSTTRFGREKGRKAFVAVDASDGLSFSRRTLEEKPQRDRNVERVTFEKASVDARRHVRKDGFDMEDTLDTRKEVVVNAIKRTEGVDKVLFDEDDEYVYVGRESVVERYRLGQDARRFLAGEFPLDSIGDGGITLILEAP